MAGSAFNLPKARTSGAPYFSRNQVAAVLHQVAVLLELQGRMSSESVRIKMEVE